MLKSFKAYLLFKRIYLEFLFYDTLCGIVYGDYKTYRLKSGKLFNEMKKMYYER